MPDQKPLRILHCFRSPVGGIFRHVRDLARLHHEAGHQVGILCDSTTGGAHEDALFDSIRPYLALGLVRTPIHRSVGPADLLTLYRCMGKIKEIQPDIIHGHGAKGGALARLIGARLRASRYRVARIYTAHGGSLHFSGSSLAGRFYFRLERFFEKSTDGLVFVSGGYGAGAIMLRVSKMPAGFQAETLFKNRECKGQIHQPIVYKDHIYINANDKGMREGLMCMDLEGNVKWKTGKSPGFDWGGMLLADGILYVVRCKYGSRITLSMAVT